MAEIYLFTQLFLLNTFTAAIHQTLTQPNIHTIWYRHTHCKKTILNIILYYACELHLCIYVGTHCSHLQKMLYLENHSYLPEQSCLRQQKKGFPTKKKELLPPPAKRTIESVKEYHDALVGASTM